MGANPPRVHVVARPYLLTFSGRVRHWVLLTSAEAAQLLRELPIVDARANRVRLRGALALLTLTAATRGGGPAFVMTRPRRVKVAR